MTDKLSRELMIELFEQARDVRPLCEAMVDMDSTGRRIPSEDRAGLISMVLGTGRDWATELRNQYPVGDIGSVAEEIGIKVEISDQKNEIGNMVIRSEYYAQPPRIILYQQSIKALQDRMERADLTCLLALDLITPIHIAHELFHHLEHLKHDPLSNRYLVTTFRFGPLRLKSGVRVLTEMGAHAFVQGWLNLDWYPYVIDQIERVAKGDTINPVEEWNKQMKKRGSGGIISRLFSGKSRKGEE